MKLLPWNPLTSVMVDSLLLDCSDAQRFEFWQKTRQRLNELERQGKTMNPYNAEVKYAQHLHDIARSAYFYFV